MVGARVGLVSVALGAGVFALGACSPPSLPPRADEPVVMLEPALRGSDARSVLRIHVSGLGPVDPNAVLLFRGALDAYHAGRIRAVALPQTLSDLRVPGVAWSDPVADGGLVLAPSQRLDAGETYSVAALGYGALQSFVTGADPEPYAERIWPPHAALHGGKRWVFCGEAPLPPPGALAVLEPAGATAVVAAGADSAMTKADTCFRLELTAFGDGGLAVAPPSLAGTSLDPAQLLLGAPPPDAGVAVPETACAPSETPLGPGCAAALDDRVVVRGGTVPLFWAVTYAATEMVVSTAPGEQFLIDGLAPETRLTLRGTATDLDGSETPFEAELRTLPPLSHVVVNEVLANPSGVEKNAEWVELFNDGASAVDVTGWTLEDSMRGVVLPRGTVPAGGYALVVPAGYDPLASVDVEPAPGTLLLRVQELGSGGLSNQGERLRLVDPDGTVRSVFPALAASKSGVSIARQTPSSPDDDPTSFGPSAPPGASPGAVNALAR